MNNTESLWRDFASRLEIYLQARIRNREDVADLLQETFLRCHTGPPPDGVPPGAWLYGIVKNLIADYYRARGADQPLDDRDPPDHERFEVRESEHHVASWLRDMAHDLPPKYSRALIAADFEGASMKDIATELDLSLSGAKSRVQRARKLLYRNLVDCCAFQLDEHGRIASWSPRAQEPTSQPICSSRDRRAGRMV